MQNEKNNINKKIGHRKKQVGKQPIYVGVPDLTIKVYSQSFFQFVNVREKNSFTKNNLSFLFVQNRNVCREKERIKSGLESGITLLSLIFTVVIMIILATVTISVTLGDGGLVEQAKLAVEKTEQATQSEQEQLASLEQELANMLAEPEIPPETVEEAKLSGKPFQETTTIKDERENEVTIPKGFKIPEDSGNTVQQGIVIEDVFASTDTAVQGSQYVWIPVGTFRKDDGTMSNEIKLGRYTFSSEDGTITTPLQYAENYTESIVIGSEFTELTDYNSGNGSMGLSGANATAKNLEGFINSVSENGGYYIGRYEASYASGASSETKVGDYANCKAASKISTEYSVDRMLYNSGTLWNFITQPSASKVAINTYEDTKIVTSDLMNSYAWDTAVVFIQEAGHMNYANQDGLSISESIGNTGEDSDEVCKINNMASNIREWTTEHSTDTTSSLSFPCVARGGVSGKYGGNYVSNRSNSSASSVSGSDTSGFRICLYL